MLVTEECGGAADTPMADLVHILGISAHSRFPLENHLYFSLAICFSPL